MDQHRRPGATKVTTPLCRIRVSRPICSTAVFMGTPCSERHPADAEHEALRLQERANDVSPEAIRRDNVEADRRHDHDSSAAGLGVACRQRFDDGHRR
jgi:hypothetical protein